MISELNSEGTTSTRLIKGVLSARYERGMGASGGVWMERHFSLFQTKRAQGVWGYFRFQMRFSGWRDCRVNASAHVTNRQSFEYKEEQISQHITNSKTNQTAKNLPQWTKSFEPLLAFWTFVDESDDCVG